MTHSNANRHFIIGGTEKAGTTSLFMWLADHPEICPSTVKETDYFRSDTTSYQEYHSRYFHRCPNNQWLLEASPGYLSEAHKASKPLCDLIPEAKLLFVLRDPVDRLFSTYRFHAGRYNIDASISFDEYVDMCLRFEEGNIAQEESGLGQWYLDSLQHGRYADKLEIFYQYFPKEQIKVMFFEHLKEDSPGFMRSLCDFIKIDFGYYHDFQFKKENVTFSGKRKWMHRLALAFNDKMEPFLRRNPVIKHKLLAIYKGINLDEQKVEIMTEKTRDRLISYYSEPNRKLMEMLSVSSRMPTGWSSVH